MHSTARTLLKLRSWITWDHSSTLSPAASPCCNLTSNIHNTCIANNWVTTNLFLILQILQIPRLQYLCKQNHFIFTPRESTICSAAGLRVVKSLSWTQKRKKVAMVFEVVSSSTLECLHTLYLKVKSCKTTIMKFHLSDFHCTWSWWCNGQTLLTPTCSIDIHFTTQNVKG